MNKHLAIIGLAISALFTTFVSASTVDVLKIDSENQDINYKDNTIYFSGNVVVTQGLISIHADELIVETQDGAAEKLIAKGKPASFIQKNEVNGVLKASAIEIIYLVEGKILKLNGEAKFEQGGSVVQSGNIEFDLKAQRVKADGDESSGGRVTTTIKTKKDSGSN